MKRCKLVLAACSILAVSAWGQTAAQPTASAGATGISGCMTSDWGRFLVSSGGATYDVKGAGSDLSSHVNHVVQIQGLPDTKAANGQTVPFYALKVQDTGACGANGTAAAASASASTTPASSAAPAQPPAMSAPPSPAEQPAANATPNNPATPNMASATPAPSPAESATQETNGGGTMAAPPQSASQTFEGCVAGSTNNYQLKSNGKTYRLQGDTTSLNGLTGHSVSITGEDFNGKAIQVETARDMGKGCKK